MPVDRQTEDNQAIIEGIVKASPPPVRDIGKPLRIQDPNQWVANTFATYARLGQQLVREEVIRVCESQHLSADETEQWLEAVGLGGPS